MKSIMKFACMFVAMFGIATLSSCDPVEPAGQSPDAPTTLEAGNITDVSAVLTWSGNAAAYEVIVGQGKAQSVTGKSYKAEGLTPETEYKWQVRAIDGEHASAWVDGTPFKTKTAGDEPQNPEPPLNLAWSDVTDTSASFTWAGTSSTYEVKVGEKVETVSAKVHTRTGLTPDTKYQWSVRSVDAEHNLYSAWVNGKEFTTLKSVGAVPYIDGICYYHGIDPDAGSGRFSVRICTAELNNVYFFPANGTGWVFGFSFSTELPKLDTPLDRRCPAIPDGTYTFSDVAGIGVAGDGTLSYFERGHFISKLNVKAGTVTIKRTGELKKPVEIGKLGSYTYLMTCDLELEDDTRYKIDFDGTVDESNRVICTHLWNNLDFGATIYKKAIVRVIDGDVYSWIFEAANSSYIDGLGFWGASPYMKFEFYTAKTVDTAAIPVGTYTIDSSGKPGTVKPGVEAQHSQSYYREDLEGGKSKDYAPFCTGAIEISKTGDVYEIKLAGVRDDAGFTIDGVYKGDVEIQAYVN